MAVGSAAGESFLPLDAAGALAEDVLGFPGLLFPLCLSIAFGVFCHAVTNWREDLSPETSPTISCQENRPCDI